jgi:hypothetical protein
MSGKSKLRTLNVGLLLCPLYCLRVPCTETLLFVLPRLLFAMLQEAAAKGAGETISTIQVTITSVHYLCVSVRLPVTATADQIRHGAPAGQVVQVDASCTPVALHGVQPGLPA